MLNTTLCYIEKDGKYLMLHRIRKENDISAGKWIGVGGKFEPGETAEECLVREVREETGYTLTEYKQIGLVKFISDVAEDEDMYLFQGTAFTGEQVKECPEGQLEWVPAEEVLGLPTWEGDRYFLDALLQGRTNIDITVRYEGDKLVEVKDRSGEPEVEISSLLQAAHGFSTRPGGVSEGIFRTMNLGRNRGDVPERVNENWRRFLGKCGITDRAVVWGKQVHKNYVHIATAEDARALNEEAAPMEADGYVTNQPGVTLAVFTADCVPVLLEDARHGVIGAVHSGWRGTVADIEGEAVKKMIALGATPEDIHVAIGPAIDQCCFEVGPEVVEAVDSLLGSGCSRFYEPRGAQYMLDLRGVVRERLIQLGVLPENIEKVGGCTMCHPDRYWSHRFTKGERGSMAAVIRR